MEIIHVHVHIPYWELRRRKVKQNEVDPQIKPNTRKCKEEKGHSRAKRPCISLGGDYYIELQYQVRLVSRPNRAGNSFHL